jgi:hypothetical protein
MGRVHPGLGIGAGMDGAQMADALLREEGEKLALQRMVAAALAGEMGEIDGGLGHFRLEAMTFGEPQMRRF